MGLKDKIRERVLKRFKKEIFDPFDRYRLSSRSLQELEECMGKRNFEIKANIAAKKWRFLYVDWVPYGSDHCVCGHPISWRYHGVLEDGTQVVLGSECIEDVLVMSGIPVEDVKIFLDDLQREIVEKVEEEIAKERVEEARKIMERINTDILKRTWFVFSGFLENISRIVKDGGRLTKKQFDILVSAEKLQSKYDVVRAFIEGEIREGRVEVFEDRLSRKNILATYVFHGNDLAVIWKIRKGNIQEFVVESTLTGHFLRFTKWNDAKSFAEKLLEVSGRGGNGN